MFYMHEYINSISGCIQGVLNEWGVFDYRNGNRGTRSLLERVLLTSYQRGGCSKNNVYGFVNNNNRLRSIIFIFR